MPERLDARMLGGGVNSLRTWLGLLLEEVATPVANLSFLS